MWPFEALTDFFSNFYGKLEFVKVKKCSPGSNYFQRTLLPGSVNSVLMKHSYTSLINPVFQNKSWVTWKHDVPCFFGRVKQSYLHHASHINWTDESPEWWPSDITSANPTGDQKKSLKKAYWTTFVIIEMVL